MIRTTTVFLAAVLFASGCAPKAYFRAMSAAAIDIPTEVQRVAVVDRSAPKNAGQTALGTIEGVLTGESLFEDHRGRDFATKALITFLEQSPRYTVVNPNVTPGEVGTNLLDKPWTFRAVSKLCEEHGCDAVIALETFDTDTNVTSGLIERVRETVDGNGSQTPPPSTGEGDAPPPTTHWAERRTGLTATWRMYDAKADRILDEVRDRSISSQTRQEAYSLDEAIGKLAQPGPMIESDGRQLGSEYGRRIAPSWVTLGRKYYGGALTPMRRAKFHVEANDWEGAKEIWKGVVDNSKSGKRVGKARYNLALAAEVEGKLEKAQKLAKKAAVEVHSKRAIGYARSLEWRIAEQAKVEAQLAPPEESP